VWGGNRIGNKPIKSINQSRRRDSPEEQGSRCWTRNAKRRFCRANQTYRHTASLPAPRSQKPEARSTEHRRQKQNQKQKREARSPPLLRAAVGERRTRRPRYIPVSPISPPQISPEGIPRASGAPHPAGTSPGRRAPPGGGYFFCSTKTEHRAPGRLSIRRPGL
jgi:hypothetical protein